MGGAFNTHGKAEKYMQDFGQGFWRKEISRKT